LLSHDLVEAVLADWRSAPIGEQVRVTLGFLEKVTRSPADVGPDDISPLRAAGVQGCVKVARFIYLLYTIPIFFGPVTFVRLFRESDMKKEECLPSPQDLTIACPLARGEHDERIEIS
jgi:hypothetical protein